MIENNVGYMRNSLLKKLAESGQSYWLDNLSRKMITSGELKRRIDHQGLKGITTNPNIFSKAILNNNAYDEQIERLLKKGCSDNEIYENLVIEDVRDACDLLKPVYKETDGVDGYVSLEVSPYLAHDSRGTMKECRRLFQTVNRPNLLIKIPGTQAGLMAIKRMLYEGININITLLFSIENYELLTLAYRESLERRLQEKKQIDHITSVASFFLSRIDALVDQLLTHRFLSKAMLINLIKYSKTWNGLELK
jgi:transaldolase